MRGGRGHHDEYRPATGRSGAEAEDKTLLNASSSSRKGPSKMSKDAEKTFQELLMSNKKDGLDESPPDSARTPRTPRTPRDRQALEAASRAGGYQVPAPPKPAVKGWGKLKLNLGIDAGIDPPRASGSKDTEDSAEAYAGLTEGEATEKKEMKTVLKGAFGKIREQNAGNKNTGVSSPTAPVQMKRGLIRRDNTKSRLAGGASENRPLSPSRNIPMSDQMKQMKQALNVVSAFQDAGLKHKAAGEEKEKLECHNELQEDADNARVPVTS